MKRRTMILFLVGLILILLLLQTLDIRQIEGKLAKMPKQDLLVYLTGLLVIQLAVMLLSALKWRVVLRNSQVSMKNIIPATFVGYLVNNITPVGLAGGEPIRAYILYKTDQISMPTSASSVIVDLFLEIFPIFIMILASIGIVYSSGVPPEVSVLLLLMTLILAVFFASVVSIAYHKPYSSSLIKLIGKIISVTPFFRRYNERLGDEFEDITRRFDEAMKLQLLDNQIIIQGVFISALVWVLRVIRLYVSFLVLGVEVALPTVVVVETMVSAVSFLPLLPGALGIWEWTSVELFSIISPYSGINISREYAAMGTLMNRLFLYLIPCVIGVIAAFYLGLNIFKITEEDKRGLEESI
ncbi:MAG: flippase-like domain-containing protein [Candidatus Altiarchaeota archaeon]|nr:flippase-like domain-containing protein [Candidatus Altiarchaeota archaeon]